MSNAKKRKKINSDFVLNKKHKTETKKLNPFEVHVNKEKFKILGRKCKHDRGLPGISRSKAIQKRKQTLGKEYQELHKVNKFKDRRINVNNKLHVDEEKIANARFTAEKIAQFKTKKGDIFNLNDDEILTHHGQTLEEIEQFPDQGSSDESENEALDAEFTEAAHFGGDSEIVDRKALIEEKILEAKRKKIEVLKEKEEVHEMTMKLDSDYKNVLSLIGKLKKVEDEPKPKQDDYDRLLKEMIFEPRGEVTDKIKSEEEIARQEKKRLEKLEQERLRRMFGEENVESNNKPKHRSADDLDDGYFVEDEPEEGVLAYELEDSAKLEKEKNNEKRFDRNTEDDSESQKSDNSSDENDSENEEQESNEEEEEGTDEGNDDLNDLKQSESETDEDVKEKFNTKINGNDVENSLSKSENKSSNKENAVNELPFIYDIPKCYETFKEYLYTQTPDKQEIIIERMLKSNHPKLDQMNREKVLQLFTYLLKYIDDIFSNVNENNIYTSFEIFSKLSPFIYDIVNLNGKSSQHLLDAIVVKYNEYKKNQKVFPRLNTIILFKLVSNIYSTSDFRHGIVTPCFVFISHILSRARIRTQSDLTLGLYIVTIFLEYTQLSKRILPAVFNYLVGVVFLCIHKKPIEVYKVMPPFSSMDSSLSNMLVLNEKITIDVEEEPMKSTDLISSQTEIENKFKIRVLNNTIKMIKDSIENISENVGARYYAELFSNMLEKLELSLYPEFIKENYEKLLNTLKSVMNKPLQRLVQAEKKPRSLRLMEPRIEKIVDDKRRPKMSKEKEQRAILLHKVKRETKSAMREIRRDTAFISKMQIKKQIQSDLERKEKVQRIFAEAAVQQGELNELSRKRKRM